MPVGCQLSCTLCLSAGKKGFAHRKRSCTPRPCSATAFCTSHGRRLRGRPSEYVFLIGRIGRNLRLQVNRDKKTKSKKGLTKLSHDGVSPLSPNSSVIINWHLSPRLADVWLHGQHVLCCIHLRLSRLFFLPSYPSCYSDFNIRCCRAISFENGMAHAKPSIRSTAR